MLLVKMTLLLLCLLAISVQKALPAATGVFNSTPTTAVPSPQSSTTTRRYVSWDTPRRYFNTTASRRYTSGYPYTSYTTPRNIPTIQSESVICKNFRDLSQDSSNFGDLTCSASRRYNYRFHYTSSNLILRETITKDDGNQGINYYHQFGGTYITKVNVLNFGKTYAFVNAVTIFNGNYGGNVSVEAEVPANKPAKLFVEVYGQQVGNFSTFPSYYTPGWK